VRIMGGVVRRRVVFHVAGYDPSPPDAMRRRFARELRRFEETWASQATVTDADPAADASWRVAAAGPNWQVETDFRLVRWDDIIAEAGRRSMARRVPLGLFAFADFAFHALVRYLRANWRYALFFLFPLLLFCLFGAAALFAGKLIAVATGSALLGIFAAVVILAVLMRWPGEKLYLPLLFDDWIFSRGYVRSRHGALESRLDRIAKDIVALAQQGAADEILIVGHSLGAALAIDLLDRALLLDPDLGAHGTRIGLVSVGSSILKIGLHARAARFRSAVQRVAAAGGIFWGDYQALSDVMNFYKKDPVATMGLPTTGRPVVRMVRFRHMLDPAIYARMRYDPYRMHCQFVSGNNRRAAYDYFMLVCGPLAAEDQAHLPEGPVSALAADGSLIIDTAR